MSTFLIQDQNYVQNGLGTLTFTVPATILNGPAIVNVPFTVRFQATIPDYPATGYGAGSGDGHGAGAGGGDIVGFAAGGSALGNGGVGQGFGAVPNNYKQPPVDVRTPASGAEVSSSLVVLVKKNGSTIYTAPAVVPGQLSLEFQTTFLCTAADSITVVLSSSAAADNLLNSVKSNVSISQGE